MQVCQRQPVALPSASGVFTGLQTGSQPRAALPRHRCVWQRSQTSRRQLSSLKVAAESSPDQSSATANPQPDNADPPDRRALLAGAAVLLGVGGVVATRGGKGSPTFSTLENGSVDLDAALANGKPTIIEFYAAW